MSAADRRLVIASESIGGADAALSLCRAILVSAPATPSGLIIEPANSVYWTGRDQKLVSTSGTLITRPSLDRLRQMARTDAAELGTRLSDLARSLNTEWDCTMAAGDLVSLACATLRGEDILLLGQRPISRSRTSVVLLGGKSGPSETARALADALAWETKTSVTTLLPDTHDGDAIVDLVDRTNAAAIVTDLDDGPIDSEVGLRSLFMAARCPIVALGAANIGKRPSRANPYRRTGEIDARRPNS